MAGWRNDITLSNKHLRPTFDKRVAVWLFADIFAPSQPITITSLKLKITYKVLRPHVMYTLHLLMKIYFLKISKTSRFIQLQLTVHISYIQSIITHLPHISHCPYSCSSCCGGRRIARWSKNQQKRMQSEQKKTPSPQRKRRSPE